ncbi:MAG TPA: PQQ-binding-like beta-propeller repeat protein [Pyrinomonadaceae bacterium]|nr:PQQ-binding-like beta-propeller repeat protein [Pyrinomonadaceae bacterium]
MRIKLSLSVLIIVIASSVHAQQSPKTSDAAAGNRTNEWLQFRGPNGTGVAEGFALPVEFSAKKNLVWKTSVPFARSSPVVTADRVFLTASEGDNLITLALDRKTRKVLWRRDVVRPRHMPIYKANDAASPTPVSDGKNVFVFFAELGLISYGPDGKERWRVPLGPFNSFYGMGGSPILIGNTLVMVCDQRTDSFIVAIDTRTGKDLWRKTRSNYEAYSTPAIYKPQNGPTQVIVLGSNSVDGYSLDKGERLWWVTRIGAYPKGVPVLGTDMVYVTGDGGEQPFLPPFDETLKQFDADKDQRVKRDEMKSQAEALDHFGWLDANNDGFIERAEWDFVRNSTTSGHGLTAVRISGQGDLTSSNVAWRVQKAYPSIPAPLMYRGVIYLMKEGGIVSSLDPASGQVLKQGRTPDALEEYYASPVAADGKVYVVSASGKVTVLKADPQWEILAMNDLDEEVWATPAIAGSNIYIRTRGALYAFGATAK